MRAVLFVDEALHNGEGVLVHCAQVRTAVSDYAATLATGWPWNRSGSRSRMCAQSGSCAGGRAAVARVLVASRDESQSRASSFFFATEPLQGKSRSGTVSCAYVVRHMHAHAHATPCAPLHLHLDVLCARWSAPRPASRHVGGVRSRTHTGREAGHFDQRCAQARAGGPTHGTPPRPANPRPCSGMFGPAVAAQYTV